MECQLCYVAHANNSLHTKVMRHSALHTRLGHGLFQGFASPIVATEHGCTVAHQHCSAAFGLVYHPEDTRVSGVSSDTPQPLLALASCADED